MDFFLKLGLLILIAAIIIGICTGVLALVGRLFGEKWMQSGAVLGFLGGGIISLGGYAIVLANGTAIAAYQAAYIKAAVTTCKTSVSYDFEMEGVRDDSIPGMMPVRWVMARTIANLRHVAREDAIAKHNGNKSACDELLRTKGHSADWDYYSKDRDELGFRLY